MKLLNNVNLETITKGNRQSDENMWGQGCYS